MNRLSSIFKSTLIFITLATATTSCAKDEPENPFNNDNESTTVSLTATPDTILLAADVEKTASALININAKNLQESISIALAGDGAAMFSLSATTIPQSTNKTAITVFYSPSSAGNHTATITLTTVGAKDVCVSLIGTATELVIIPEAVDLGLPSGTKWATFNVGANRPQDYGDLFEWAEITPMKEYTTTTYSPLKSMYPDISNNPNYDAAQAIWGGEWRMPTMDECKELLNNCDWSWTNLSGVFGYEVKSKTNGNKIFLPAAGYCNQSLHLDKEVSGCYWSSTPIWDKLMIPEVSYNIEFNRNNNKPLWLNYNNIYGYGASIRPVLSGTRKECPTANVSSASGQINGYNYVDMGLSVKWATCNIGANSIENYGDYFSWGEITPKGEYTYNNSNINTRVPYFEYTSGDSNFDAARANWGETWRIPTEAEITELIENCNKQLTILNGIKGYEVTSNINGNSIFFPAAGFIDKTTCHFSGYFCDYWSSTANTGIGWDGTGIYAISLSWYNDCFWQHSSNRYFGKPVRPVTN